MSYHTDAQLADIYRKQQSYFDTEVKPLLDKLNKDRNSTEMVDDAKAQRERMAKVTPEMQARSQSRFMGGMSAAQQHSISRMNDTMLATGGTALVNNARAGQQERNTSLKGDLSTAYDSLLQGSTSGLSVISQNEAARKAQHEANKSSFGSSLLGAIGTIGGGLLGGPMGAAAGGAIGSTIGGYL